jgi:hypothetical protein
VVKKLFLILLLTILPIQYAWSMAAVYCQHETSKVTHFGHHGHQHQAQSDDGADQGKLSKHGDCEVCHHAVQAAAPGAEAVLTLARAAVFTPSGVLHYHSYIADGPPRPNWSFVA